MDTYDLIIIGGGPAAVAAGIYAARKKIKTLLITKDFGGQSMAAAKIENFIGLLEVSGVELAKRLENHLKKYADDILKINEGELVEKISKVNNLFEVKSNKNSYQTKAIIIAAGSRRRKLNVWGEDEFTGKGVSYCAICDAPLFKNKDVAVIGGGNAGFEAARDLINYANKIYILEFSDKIKADPITVEQVKSSNKTEIILNAQVLEIRGDKFVEELIYRDLKSGINKSLKVEGVFVEIGSVPNTEMVKDLVKLNQKKEIIIDHKTCATSVPGIFAAGDITDVVYKQNNISIGDGIKAALSVYDYLQNK